MQSLTELIRIIPPDSEETPEDIFASAPGLIFTDDLRNQHGDAGDIIVYKSKRFGELEVQTADPSGESERRLFSHYLWNAGLLMAERLSGERLLNDSERQRWNVQDQSVIELGAGVGLAGITSTLAGAKEVVISDYPSPVILDNIRRNVDKTIPTNLQPRVTLQGHEWGVLDDAFSMSQAHSFSRVLAADCYWMPQVHVELVQSMLHFLSLAAESKVLAIAGFHTGRAKLAAFFDVAVEQGLEIEEIYEEDANGKRRPWAKERDGGRENPTERKKWLVTAVLRRASS